MKRINNYGLLKERLVAFDFADAAAMGSASNWLLAEVKGATLDLEDEDLRERYRKARDLGVWSRSDPFRLEAMELLEAAGWSTAR